MIVKAGSTNVSVYYYIVQDASGTSPGEPATGLLFSDIETGGSASYARQGAARTDLTLITLASASAAHADGGFILVDDTNMPGLYRCDYPDAAFTTGVDQVFLQIVVASSNNAVAAPISIIIDDSVDQTGDSYARIGAAGASLTDLGGMSTAMKAEVNAEADTALTDYDGPTNTEMEARTLVAASYFDPAADAVANVTLVATTTTNTDMRGTDSAATATNLATVDTNVDAILVDTATTIPGQISGLNDVAATDIVSAGAITTLSGAIVNVDLVDTTTTNTDMRGTDSALLAASINLTAGAVDNVTLVATTTTNTDMRGTDSAATAANLATVDTNVDAILVDTGTTIPATLGTPADTDISTDIANVQTSVGNLAVGSSAISTQADSYTLTTGTQSSGTVSDTETLNSVEHQHTDTAGALELYYEFDVGTSGVASEVTIIGRINGANDDLDGIYAYDWVGAQFDRMGDYEGQNGTANNTTLVSLLTRHTGTGANIGKVRIRFFAAAGLTSAELFIDQIFASYASVAAETLIFASGVAQSGGNNSIQLASGDVTANDLFRRSKVIIVSGLGIGQEAIITSSVASTDTLTVTPTWLTNPDSTSVYEVIPAQAHSTVRNGGYDNAMVYVDSSSGNTGSERGVDGTTTNPVNNLTDAFAIAAQEGLTSISIYPGSAVTLPSAATGLSFAGSNYTVALGGQDIGDCEFNGASQVTGIGVNASGNPPTFILCGIGSVTLPPSNGFQCGFFGTFTIGTAGSFTWGGCASLLGLGLTIDYDATDALDASSFDLQSWGGGSVTIQNGGRGTGTYALRMNGMGELIVESNCVLGTSVDLHGNIELTDNGVSTAVNVEANISNLPTTAEFEVRTPTAAELAYIVANSATAVPVTFTSGTTTTAVLNLVDGSAAEATDNDYYNGRLLVFTSGNLEHVVTDITDYVASTATATFTAVPNSVTSGHTARLI